MNEVTSFIDASTVYGSNSKKAASLRGVNGTLKIGSEELFLKGLLPFQPTSKGCAPLAGNMSFVFHFELYFQIYQRQFAFVRLYVVVEQKYSSLKIRMTASEAFEAVLVFDPDAL